MSRFAPHAAARTLVQFAEPVSPHVAATQSDGALPDAARDEHLVSGIGAWIHDVARRATHPTAAYVETAGGVHSPAPSGVSQAELLRPLRLPVVLIGSSALGGISTTRAAYEALRMRGYDVDAVLLFPSPVYRNDDYLRGWLAEQGVPVFALGGPAHGAWGAPPVRAESLERDAELMHTYYTGLVRGADEGPGMADVVRHLRARHAARIDALATLGSRAHECVWWPFTQHARVAPHDVTVIESAHGDFFAAYSPTQPSLLTPLFDGSASWWTQIFGHSHPRLTAAAAYAAGRFGHVMFPAAANEPAVTLAERLLGCAPDSDVAPGRGWASRVFYSDDGSTAMEVALKMALQASVRRFDAAPTSQATLARIERGRERGSLGGRPPRELGVLGLRGSYHGDTIGAMDACEPSLYSEHVAWYRGRGYWITPPTLGIERGRIVVRAVGDEWEAQDECLATLASLDEAYNVRARLATPLAEQYRSMLHALLERLVRVEGRRFGALVLEPLVMGAGGMLFIDPLFQRCLVDVGRGREALFRRLAPPLRDARAPAPRAPDAWRGLPVVFDEVFTGLFRVGHASAADVLGCTPDIACYAKVLTGGLVPLAATLASRSIFDAFAPSTSKAHALLHGHSYTAHPVGCAVANETLTMLSEMRPQRDGYWDSALVERLSHSSRVQSVMALGTVLKVELADPDPGYASGTADAVLAAARDAPQPPAVHPTQPESFPMHLRALGNVLYVMCNLTTPREIRSRAATALARLVGAE